MPSPPSIRQAPSSPSSEIPEQTDRQLAAEVGVQQIETFLPAILEQITPQNASRIELIGDFGKGVVRDFDWAPDGQTIAVATPRGLYIYDAETGEEIKFVDTQGNQTSLAYSPDGLTIASGAEDGTISVWQVATGQRLTSYSGHESPVTRILYSSDGRMLASLGTDENFVMLRDAGSGRLISQLQGSELQEVQMVSKFGDETFRWSRDGSGYISDIAVSPGGEYLAAISDLSLRLWELDTGGLRNVVALEGAGKAVAFSPDGQTMATTHYGGWVTTRHAGTGQPYRTWKADKWWSSTVAFSPDGTLLATTGANPEVGGVQVWNLETRAEPLTIGSERSREGRLAFSPDSSMGEWRLAGSAGGTIDIWADDTDQPSITLDGHLAFGSYLGGSDILVDEERSLVILIGSRASMWQLRSGEMTSSLGPSDAEIVSHAVSSDLNVLAVGLSNGRIAIWDLKGPTLAHYFDAHSGPVWYLAMDPAGSHLASTGGDDGVRVWDFAAGILRYDFQAHAKGVGELFFYRGGERLAATGSETDVQSSLRTWEIAGGNFLSVIREDQSWVSGYAATRDGSRLAIWDTHWKPLGRYSRSTTTSTRLVDPTNLRVIQTVEGGGPVFSPYGDRIATSSNIGEVWLWSADTGESLVKLETQLVTPFSYPVVAISASGELLATAGGQGTSLTVWEVDNGQMIAEFPAQPAATTQIRFADGDKLLLVAGFDGIVRIYGIQPWSSDS